MAKARKPVMMGCDYLRGSDWKPLVRTLKGAQRIAGEKARKVQPHGFWNGIVVDCGPYWRINLAGQPERR